MASDPLTLQPIRNFSGTLELPGSKSLSNRLLLLAALARQRVQLEGFLDSQDTRHLKAALVQLGWRIAEQGSTLTITPQEALPAGGDLFLGNAGTAMRPLCAALTTFPGEFRLHGEPRMHERPIGPLVEALRELGADIRYQGQPGYPPLILHSKGLEGGRATLDATLSSQFISAILMAAPRSRQGVELTTIGDEVSLSYVEMTVRQLALFGVRVERSGRTYQVAPQEFRAPARLRVEGDASSASYFLGAAAVAGGPVRVVGAGSQSCQGEIGFARVLEQMGAQVRWGEDWVEVERGRLRGVDVDLRDLPDTAMTLATVALFADGPTSIRGVANWKVKETDRQAALSQELQKLGAGVELLPDGIRVTPPQQWRSATIETYQDHRMAMCFALASLGPEPQTILDPACVAKTFPDFFQRWSDLSR